MMCCAVVHLLFRHVMSCPPLLSCVGRYDDMKSPTENIEFQVTVTLEQRKRKGRADCVYYLFCLLSLFLISLSFSVSSCRKEDINFKIMLCRRFSLMLFLTHSVLNSQPSPFQSVRRVVCRTTFACWPTYLLVAWHGMAWPDMA